MPRHRNLKITVASLTLSLLTAGCNDAPVLLPGAPAHQKAAIVNGTIDTGHQEVGALHSGNIAACTATLIGKRTVLTAAHCILDDNHAPLWPVNFYIGGLAGTKYSASKAIAHPAYSGGNASDVAVVKLSQDVVGVTPARLATSAPALYEPIVMVGYGLPGEETGKYGTKRKAHNLIADVEYEVFRMDGSSGSYGNLCDGDSGGPTFTQRGGQETLIGVHSTKGGTCGERGFDMRVDRFHAWISKQAGDDLYTGPAANELPPSVSIIQPTAGATLGSSFLVSVAASDSVGLARVELYIDGVQASSRSTGPFDFQLQNLSSGGHTIEAVAIGSTGRSASAAATISVVTTDPATQQAPPPASPTDSAAGSPVPGSYGAECTDHGECASGMCATDGATGAMFCTAECDAGLNNCPTGSLCHPIGQIAVCAPDYASNDDVMPAQDLDGQLHGGCSLGSSAAAPTTTPWLVIVVLLGLRLVRRRR